MRLLYRMENDFDLNRVQDATMHHILYFYVQVAQQYDMNL